MADKNDLIIAGEVRMAVSRLLRQFRKQVKHYPVSMTEQTTLVLIDQYGEILPSELAALEKMTAQSMSQILNRLSLLGYIHRQTAPGDKRKVLISLSKEGKEVLTAMRHMRAEWLAAAMSRLLTAEEKKILRQAAGILQRLADFDE